MLQNLAAGGSRGASGAGLGYWWVPIAAAAIAVVGAITAALINRGRNRFHVKLIRSEHHLHWRERVHTPIPVLRLELWNNGPWAQAFSKSRLYYRAFPFGRVEHPPEATPIGNQPTDFHHLEPGTAIEELHHLSIWVQRDPSLGGKLVWVRAAFRRDRRRVTSRWWRLVRLPRADVQQGAVLLGEDQ